MQSDYKEIYRLTSERTGESEQLYKELGNFVFQSLYSNLRKPKSLLIKLKGLGTWYLRKERMEIAVLNNMTVMKNDDKNDIIDVFSERLKDYEEYLELRKQIRLKRNETQRLLHSKDEGTEAS